MCSIYGHYWLDNSQPDVGTKIQTYPNPILGDVQRYISLAIYSCCPASLDVLFDTNNDPTEDLGYSLPFFPNDLPKKARLLLMRKAIRICEWYEF